MNTRPLLLLAAFACGTPKTASDDGSSVSPLPSDGSEVGDGSDDNNDDNEDGSEPTDPANPEDPDDTPDTPDDEEDTPEDDTDASDDEDDDTDVDDTPPLPAEDLTVSGPSEVSATSGSFTTTGGSELAYERFIPFVPRTTGEVFVMHGFMRSKDQFTEIAAHLATWGITSTAMTMMHSSVVDIDPVENSADVVELAEHLGADQVVWIGHSNGGISALIASAMAPDISLAVLGLDPVEAIGGDGADWTSEVTVPVAALIGEEDTCNSNNSGLPVFLDAGAIRTIRITEADHCNFESPTNWLCTLSCSRTKTTFTDDAISATITEMATSWALGYLLPEFDQEPWWGTTGSTWIELESAGAATSL